MLETARREVKKDWNAEKAELDYLLDTTPLNKKLRDRRDNPYRWKTGSFSVPKGISGIQLKRLADEAVKRWLTAFEKQGWTLASKVQVYKGKPFAYDISLGATLLDKEEICCRAIFKTEPKPVRIEVPGGIVRRDPEQSISLNEAMKAEGITAVPRKERIKR